MAAKLPDQYHQLFQTFANVEREMRERPRDGQQAELLTAARAIIRFEHEHELPRLKELVSGHGTAVAAAEAAKQKLVRLERSIESQQEFIKFRFPNIDTTVDALDLLGWELSARLGAQAVEQLTARAVQLEQDLRLFIKGKSGLSDCLLVQQKYGWDKVTAESFDWLRREAVETAGEAVAA